MKVFRREVFEGLPLTTDSPFLSAELLIKLRARGERIAQVGVDPLPASGRHEHRRVVPQDPAHVPRHRQAALGALDPPARGAGPPRRRGVGLLGASALARSGQVDIERVHEVAEDGEALLVEGIALLSGLRLDAGLVEDALIGIDGRPGAHRDRDGVRCARVDLGLVAAGALDIEARVEGPLDDVGDDDSADARAERRDDR